MDFRLTVREIILSPLMLILSWFIRNHQQKDIFSPIMFNVSPEFNVISIFKRSFECFLISSETIYVPSPHGSSIDITKCDAFSIRSFTF